MDGIAIYVALFIVLFFSVSSVENNHISEFYLKDKIPTIDSIAGLAANNFSTIPSTTRENLFNNNKLTQKTIRITSIDKTVSKSVDSSGKQRNRLSIYVIFANPTLRGEGNTWNMDVRIDVLTKDKNGKIVKSLTGAPLQEINNKYGYELDSGAFVFNVNLDSGASDVYLSRFIIKDIFSGAKDEKTVSINF